MKIEVLNLYEDRKDVTLTAYIQDDSTELAAGKKRPAIIINPGGAYIMLSDREAEPVAMRFAGMGFQTFVLRYSVLNGGTNAWPEDAKKLPPKNSRTEYPAPLLELGKAILTVRERAEEWFVDKDQIGICGFSAGGHNCTLYASDWWRSVLTDKLNVQAEELRPAFCIAGYPFTDWELEYDLLSELDETSADYYRMMYYDYFGETDPSVDKMRECSSDRQVTEKTVPSFIWTTAEDKSVDPRHSIRLVNAMAEYGVPYEFHIFGEGHHGLALADQSTLQNPDDISDVVAQWIPLVEKWLKKYVRFGAQRKDKSE